MRKFARGDLWLFWSLLLAPPLLILIFFVIPAGLRPYRERQVSKLAPAAAAVVPGYFRIQPFEVADKERYHRPDNAVERALAWLRRETDPVLYLSGASGAGKSSLVAAGLAPALETAGWTVLFVRSKGEPYASLLATLGTRPARCSAT